MPIPQELQQAFTRVQLVEQAIAELLRQLQQCMTVAKGALDEIKDWHDSHPAQ